MISDTRVEANALDNRFCVKSSDLRISIKFIKVRHTKCKICIREQLNRFRLSRIHKADFNVLLESTLFEKIRKSLRNLVKSCILYRDTDNDTARIEIVVKSASLTKKFRAEKKIVTAILFSCTFGKTYGNCGFHDHHGIRIDGNNLLYHTLDRTRVKIVFRRVIIGRGRNNYNVRITICAVAVGSRFEVKFLCCKILLNLFVNYRRFFIIYHLHLFGNDVNSLYSIVLRQKNCHGKTDIPGTRYCYFHFRFLLNLLKYDLLPFYEFFIEIRINASMIKPCKSSYTIPQSGEVPCGAGYSV